MKRSHLVYFACGRHFNYLHASLKSVRRIRSPWIGRIAVYVDAEDFLSPQQEQTLQALGLPLQIHRWGQVTGWGELTITRELEAFRAESRDTDPGDYIAKVDTDVFFASDAVFAAVAASDADIAGEREHYWNPFAYTQGGCYFLRCALVRTLPDADANLFGEVLRAMNNPFAHSRGHTATTCPEDAAIFTLARRCSANVRFLDHYGMGKSVVHCRDKAALLKFDREAEGR